MVGEAAPRTVEEYSNGLAKARGGARRGDERRGSETEHGKRIGEVRRL